MIIRFKKKKLTVRLSSMSVFLGNDREKNADITLAPFQSLW